MSFGVRLCLCVLLGSLALSHSPSSLAAKSKEAAQQCPYWETQQGSVCVPCPEDQQQVIDGRDTCASNGGLGLSEQDEEDDDQK